MDVFGFYGNGADGRLLLNRVIDPMASCAKSEKCWNGISTANQATTDSVAISGLLYASTCYTCNRDTPYHAYGADKDIVIVDTNKSIPLSRHLQAPYQVLFDRQSSTGTPYARFLKESS